MAIIKIKLNRNFTVLPNDLLNDERLDWQDLGLLTHLLSKPENWEIHVSQLISSRSSGKHRVYGMMKKLIDTGYCCKKHLPEGGVEYIISPEPLSENRETGDPLPKKPLPNNQTLQKKDLYKTLLPSVAGDFPIPDGLCLSAWEAWTQHRKIARLPKYKTDGIAKKLAAIPPNKQMECVQHSIDNEYKGIFPERFNENSRRTSQHHRSEQQRISDLLYEQADLDFK